MRIHHLCAVLALFITSLAALAQEKPAYMPPTKDEALAAMKQGRYLATVTMDNDKKFEMVLEGAFAPFTVANFIKLANAKFYDGLTFHRLLDPYLIQGGDQKGDGTGSPGYAINMEISPFLSHKRGAVALAHIDRYPNTGDSQFYIAKSDMPGLDGVYAVFGWVKSGMEVVDKIKTGDVMKTVTVTPYQGTEAAPILVDGIKPAVEASKAETPEPDKKKKKK